jgi:hypothetical protein
MSAVTSEAGCSANYDTVCVGNYKSTYEEDILTECISLVGYALSCILALTWR